MTDKRTCGNCVECYRIQMKDSIIDVWTCREGRMHDPSSNPDLAPACSRHLYYDEVFGDRDELRERLQIVSRETSGVIRTDE